MHVAPSSLLAKKNAVTINHRSVRKKWGQSTIIHGRFFIMTKTMGFRMDELN